MSDKRFTEDEIRAAHRHAKVAELYGKDVAPVDNLVVELSRPEIGPDVVVTYDVGRDQSYVGRYGEVRAINQAPATNIMPHYPETKVLEWADAAWERGWWDGPTHHKRWWQTKMDAHKRGEG